MDLSAWPRLHDDVIASATSSANGVRVRNRGWRFHKRTQGVFGDGDADPAVDTTGCAVLGCVAHDHMALVGHGGTW